MLDLGWQELFLITLVALVAVGPKELPTILRSISRWIKGARSAVRTFQDTIEEVARETELEEIRNQTNEILVRPISETIEASEHWVNKENKSVELSPIESSDENKKDKLSIRQTKNQVRDITPETKD